MRRRSPVICLVASLVICGSTGCANSNHGELVGFLRAHQQAVSTGHYTVMPPDSITIHAPVSPEIDGVKSRVRPDGKISLRLLGEVDVAGLTTEQIAEKLRRGLSRFYVDPEVVVDIAGYQSQHYYVFGQVRAPGPRAFTGRDTLLNALADAVPTFLAWRSQIRVIRPSPDDGEQHVIVVDLDKMVEGGDVSQNILLQPGDIVQVPPTPLAWAGLRVRELLFPIDPALRLYNGPSQAIDSTRTYEDELGDHRSGSRRNR